MASDALAPVWKALADPTRRRMLDLLKQRPRTTGELCGFFDLSRFAVMKHLAVLEAAGLIVVRRRGRERWNHLNAVPLQRIYERWISPYEAHWASSLVRLKRHAERAKGEGAMRGKEPTTPIVIGMIAIEQEVTIEASPARVFDALTKEVVAWWGAPYLMSPDAAKDLVLEPEPGGRFFESWGDGQGSLWATVTAIKPAQRLELTGPIGMRGAVLGVVSIELHPKGNGTLLTLSHRAVGEVTPEIRASYASGWSDLLGTRLKVFVETGTRYGLGREPRTGGRPGCQES